MARNKSIIERDERNAQTLKLVKNAFPDASIQELNLIPRVSGFVVWEGFEPMDRISRQGLLQKTLGELYNGCYLRMLTPQEWVEKLEERDNPMD